jgi:two-component system, OmpR family, phosphate regulon sensor histidine kinase PhoR
MILSEFANLIRQHREALLATWRNQIREFPSADGLDMPTLTDHMPSFLEELAQAFEENSNCTIAEKINEVSPKIHGLQRFNDGFDIGEVVAEYNVLRACVHDLASTHQFSLQGQPFRILNRVFDRGIGIALEAYAANQALEVQKKREEYLAFVVHDLRTPLSAISLAARVLEKKLPVQGYTADSAQMIRSLQRSVKQLDSIVRKVLEENTHYDSIDGVALQLREFDVWPMIETLIDELQPVAASAGVTLVNEVPVELVVRADASALKRVFQNLLANAIKHAPNGQVIVNALQLQEPNRIQFSVRDNGQGIPAERQQIIFEKGETDSVDGVVAGLGLTIVKMLVQAHSGSVRVESTYGQGSSFFIELPLMPLAV